MVTPDTIGVALGRTADPSTPEWAQWALWIDDAMMLIGARLGDVTLLDQAKLDYVIREAVVAHARNPDDATQVSVTIQDASTSRSYRTSRGRVVILDEWWELLAPTESTGKAFEVDTMPADAFGAYGVDYLWVTTTDQVWL